MLWTIVRKELASNLVSFRFILIFLLCCTLILVSAYTMRDRYEDRVKEYSAAVIMHKQELEEAAGGQGLNQAAISGYKLDKPPTPLSVIVEGMEEAAGRYSTISILSTPTLEGGSGSDPMFAYFGTLDVMYIVRVVLSLVAILLTYDAVSGEREQGTLKLSLSNSVPRATVLLSKCIGGYITLILPFLVPLLFGLLILITSGSINFVGEDWARLGLVFLGSLLYIGIFLMLGLLVSSRTNRSTTALMMLLFIWVVIVLAVPKVSMIVAGKIHEVPSVQEVQSEKDTAMAQIMQEGQKKIQDYAMNSRPDMSKPGEREKFMAEIARMQEEMFSSINKKRAQLDADYEAKKAAQFRLASRISRISPASVYTYSSTTMARTGFDRQERFIRSARVYQVGFVQYFNDLLAKMMKVSNQPEEVQKMKFDLDELPAPGFKDATLAESWNMSSFDLLILFLLVACFFMIGYVGFVRSDVR
jgi:ABC-type transport system involved in multi-copper enzyme maturation permease subunit